MTFNPNKANTTNKRPTRAAVNSSFPATNFFGSPFDVIICKAEKAIKRKETPPAIPIAQVRINSRNSLVSSKGTHPIAVSTDVLPAHRMSACVLEG